MDCGRTSISLSPEEQLPVFRGRLSRIRESDGVLPHSYFGANSRTAEFQHSHLGDIAQKHAMLTNSRIQVGEHRRIQLLPGEHHPKGWIGLNSQIPAENIIQPTNQLKSVHRLHQPADTASKPHRTTDAPASRTAAQRTSPPHRNRLPQRLLQVAILVALVQQAVPTEHQQPHQSGDGRAARVRSKEQRHIHEHEERNRERIRKPSAMKSGERRYRSCAIIVRM